MAMGEGMSAADGFYMVVANSGLESDEVTEDLVVGRESTEGADKHHVLHENLEAIATNAKDIDYEALWGDSGTMDPELAEAIATSEKLAELLGRISANTQGLQDGSESSELHIISGI